VEFLHLAVAFCLSTACFDHYFDFQVKDVKTLFSIFFLNLKLSAYASLSEFNEADEPLNFMDKITREHRLLQKFPDQFSSLNSALINLDLTVNGHTLLDELRPNTVYQILLKLPPYFLNQVG